MLSNDELSKELMRLEKDMNAGRVKLDKSVFVERHLPNIVNNGNKPTEELQNELILIAGGETKRIDLMDNETFEQITVAEEMVDAPAFLKEGQEVSVLINGETELPMGVELPDKIVLMVTYSEPGVKGDTATRTLKPATLETGASINVPLFVNEGELIRINSKTGEYVERVK